MKQPALYLLSYPMYRISNNLLRPLLLLQKTLGPDPSVVPPQHSRPTSFQPRT